MNAKEFAANLKNEVKELKRAGYQTINCDDLILHLNIRQGDRDLSGIMRYDNLSIEVVQFGVVNIVGGSYLVMRCMGLLS